MRGAFARARPLAVGGRAVLRIRRQHGARQHRQRGMQYLPVHLHALHLHPVAATCWAWCPTPSPSPATSSSPSRMALFVFLSRHHHRLRQERAGLPEALRAVGRAVGPAAADPVLEIIFLPHPAVQPVGPTVRQHDGGPHDAEGVRRLRGRRSVLLAAGRRSCSWWRSPGLELLVAFLQAFVFAILTCIYLNDALHMHH